MNPFLTSKDIQQISLIDECKQKDLLLKIWTEKEALLKGIGCGIGGTEDPIKTLQEAKNWSIKNIDIDPGYFISLAYNSKDPVLTPKKMIHNLEILINPKMNSN